MNITVEQIKELRDKTGVSIMQCKKALEETEGDIPRALVVLQKKSGATAQKKSERALASGTIASYIHSGGTVGAIVELGCETDFVARNEEFQRLAYDIAMHIAAMNPTFLAPEDIREEDRQTALLVFEREVEGKSSDMRDKILDGKMNAYFKDKVLQSQAYIKDANISVGELIKSAVQKFGENIRITRYARYSTSD